MPTPEIEEFAKIIVQQVRDAAIQAGDATLRANAKGAIAERWKALAQDGNLEAVAKVLIPDIVDETVFRLLHAIDDGSLPLSFTASNGKNSNLSADGLGELAGWYMGIPGWRSTHSSERFVDDFSDLR